jgi:hypothetical protein
MAQSERELFRGKYRQIATQHPHRPGKGLPSALHLDPNFNHGKDPTIFPEAMQRL